MVTHYRVEGRTRTACGLGTERNVLVSYRASHTTCALCRTTNAWKAADTEEQLAATGQSARDEAKALTFGMRYGARPQQLASNLFKRQR